MTYKFFFLLEELKKQAKCLDKQVACIITDAYDNILSIGVNEVVHCGGCTKEGSKATCAVRHAERVAIDNLHPNNICEDETLKAYLSLYPCEKCQTALSHIVSEIYVYGGQHKKKVIATPIMCLPNLSLDLPAINGEQKQLAIIQGEQAELVTAISDFFYREHEREDGIDSLLDEIVDSKTQTSILMAILQANYSSSVYADLGEMEQQKLMKVKDNIVSGRIKRGSPYTKSLNDK
jgi:deoxycytidylate deaminase